MRSKVNALSIWPEPGPFGVLYVYTYSKLYIVNYPMKFNNFTIMSSNCIIINCIDD